MFIWLHILKLQYSFPKEALSQLICHHSLKVKPFLLQGKVHAASTKKCLEFSLTWEPDSAVSVVFWSLKQWKKIIYEAFKLHLQELLHLQVCLHVTSGESHTGTDQLGRQALPEMLLCNSIWELLCMSCPKTDETGINSKIVPVVSKSPNVYRTWFRLGGLCHACMFSPWFFSLRIAVRVGQKQVLASLEASEKHNSWEW